MSHSALRTPHSALRGLTISVLGAGTMGSAIVQGLLARGVPGRRLAVADSDPATRRRAAQRFHLHVHSNNLHVLRDAQVVIVAVKPQQFPELIAQLAPHLTRRHVVISIAAGLTVRWLQQRLPNVPIIRVMPNLPATVGCGFSAMTPGRRARAQHLKIAEAIFGAVGATVVLPERFFDAITAVSGSGPAYVCFLVDAWERAARSLGLPPAVAARAIRSTLEGSVKLLSASDDSASTLIARVASKGGTTEAALRVLARRRVSAHLVEAVKAAATRSQELSWP